MGKNKVEKTSRSESNCTIMDSAEIIANLEKRVDELEKVTNGLIIRMIDIEVLSEQMRRMLLDYLYINKQVAGHVDQYDEALREKQLDFVDLSRLINKTPEEIIKLVKSRHKEKDGDMNG